MRLDGEGNRAIGPTEFFEDSHVAHVVHPGPTIPLRHQDPEKAEARRTLDDLPRKLLPLIVPRRLRNNLPACKVSDHLLDCPLRLVQREVHTESSAAQRNPHSHSNAAIKYKYLHLIRLYIPLTILTCPWTPFAPPHSPSPLGLNGDSGSDGDEIDVGGTERGEAAEFGLDGHADPVERRGLRVEPDHPSQEEGIHTGELNEGENERSLFQERFTAVVAHGKRVDLPLLGKVHPVARPPAFHTMRSWCRVGVVAIAAPGAQQSLVGQPGKEGAVLRVAVNVIDLIVVLDDQGRQLPERPQVLRKRYPEEDGPLFFFWHTALAHGLEPSPLTL